MKSLRSWLISIAIGATPFGGAQTVKAQTQMSGVPRAITYQGLLVQGEAPYIGVVQLDFYFSDSAGATSFHETHTGVLVTDGFFNVLLGDPSITPGGFPKSMTFNEQYLMTVVVNNQTTLPVQNLWSAPYALNAQRVGGIDVSSTPVNGDIFPMPLNDSGKIDQSMLPLIPNNLLQSAPVVKLNSTVLPDESGNINLVAGIGITIAYGPGNQLTISASSGGPNNEVIGQSGNPGVALTVQDSELNGNEALLIKGGIGAGNPTGAADGTGLTPGSPQTYWADQVSVPAGTATSLQIYNKLVSATSTILVTPYGLANVGPIVITSQGAGTFTVSTSGAMGTNSGGSMTGLNYMIINH